MENNIRKRNFNYRPYYIWTSMRQRCRDKKCLAYSDYGGRGIKVCKEWEDFDKFHDWLDISGYKDNLTLDRINNNKGYYPGNCRWVDRIVQANNRRNTKLFSFNGEENTLTNWAKLIGIKRSTLAQRIYVYHWSVEKTLTNLT